MKRRTFLRALVAHAPVEVEADWPLPWESE